MPARKYRALSQFEEEHSVVSSVILLIGYRQGRFEIVDRSLQYSVFKGLRVHRDITQPYGVDSVDRGNRGVQRYLSVYAINLQDNTEANGESKSVFHCHQAMEVKSRRRQYRKLRPIQPQLRGVGEVVAELRGTMSLTN